jgi:RHS repeat-associated protein
MLKVILLLLTLSNIFANGNIPLHEWTAPQEESTIKEKGKQELNIPENLITWIFEDGTFVPLAKLQAGKSYSIITDHLGTPFEAYNEEGKKVWQCQLDIYGKIRTFTGNRSFIPFRFQGQYEDQETGLYYNRFRYYNPDSGTYISQDPIGLLGDNPNFYAYVTDSNTWIDPFGLTQYIIYQAVDLDTGKIYTGRTSGADNLLVEQIMNKRKSGHHRNLGEMQSVFETENYKAVRGAEQHHIENMRKKGMATDQINGIGPRNEKGDKYMEAFNAENNKKKISCG